MKRLVLLALLLAAGCKPDLTRIEVTQITDPPVDATITPTEFVLAEGTAVAVDVIGFDNENEERRLLSLTSTVPGDTFGYAGVGVEDRIVFYGSKVGTGTLVFVSNDCDGQVEVPITVTAQAP